MSNEYKPVGQTLEQMNQANRMQFADVATPVNDLGVVLGDAEDVDDAAPSFVGQQMHSTLKSAGFRKHEVSGGQAKYRLKVNPKHEMRLNYTGAGAEASWEHRNRGANVSFQSAGHGNEALHKYLKKVKF